MPDPIPAAETPAASTLPEDRFYGKEPAASEPAPQAKPAESEPAKPSEPAKAGETAPESEPGEPTEEQRAQETPEQRSKRDNDTQLKRLHRQNQRINRELGEARAEARRYQEELAAQHAKQPEPAPGHTDGRPQLEDFATIAEYDTARDAWVEKKTRERFEQERQQQTAKQRQAELDSTWDARAEKYQKASNETGFAEKFKENYAQFLGVVARASHADLIAEAVLESEHGPAIVDYMAEHEGELNALVRASRTGIGKLIAKLEDKFAARPAPPKPNTTNAPRAPSTVSGNGSSASKLTREDKFYGKE